MNKTIITIVILFVVLMIVELLLNGYKKSVQNKLVSLLALKKYDEFDSLIEKKQTKFFVPVVNYHIMKMNEAILQNNNDDLLYQLNKLDSMKLNKQQKTFVYCRVFAYFININDLKNIDKYYSKILALDDSLDKKYAIMVYNTIIEKGYEYIDEAEKMLESLSSLDKANMLALLSQMYTNKGDDKKANEYLEMAKNNL